MFESFEAKMLNNQKIVNKFNVFSRVTEELQTSIKLFHIFDEPFAQKSVLFVTNDDRVFGFGSNNWGKCGSGYSNEVSEPLELLELRGSKIKKFLIGEDFVLAINQQNNVYGWGYNYSGEIGIGRTSPYFNYLIPNHIDLPFELDEICCGYYHSLALSLNGNVFSWGFNRNGQVGCGWDKGHHIAYPIQLEIPEKVKTIYCSGDQSFAVTDEGLVYSWGDNCDYLLGYRLEGQDSFLAQLVFNGYYWTQWEPKLIENLTCVKSIGCSVDTDSGITYFLTNDGNIYFCGKIAKDLYQVIPEQLQTGIKFQEMKTFNYYLSNHNFSKTLALCEETVYVLESNSIKRTKYKTFFDYCLNEHQITFKSTGFGFEEGCEKWSKIGEGGFGEVFKVWDYILDSECAVKVVKSQTEVGLTKEDLKEVEFLYKYSGIYIVKYFDSWLEKSIYYIKMELLDDNLGNIIEEKKKHFNTETLDEMNCIEFFICYHLMKEILECVQYLHQLSPPIIHRDLKPQNILLNYCSTNGRFLKLADFGLATYGSDQTITHTMWKGTQRYTAPEVNEGTDGRTKYNEKADVFSLGRISCDLFNFDINSSSYENPKFIELKLIIKQMMSFTYRDRPTCADVLSNYQRWRISDCKESQINQIRQFENQFFYDYFVTKVNHLF